MDAKSWLFYIIIVNIMKTKAVYDIFFTLNISISKVCVIHCVK